MTNLRRRLGSQRFYDGWGEGSGKPRLRPSTGRLGGSQTTNLVYSSSVVGVEEAFVFVDDFALEDCLDDLSVANLIRIDAEYIAIEYS